MKPKCFMVIAGEASGDLLAAELVSTLRHRVLARESAITSDVQPLRTELVPGFFGAGGSRMKSAGVEIVQTLDSIIGISEVFTQYFKFRAKFKQLLKLAIDRQPDVIIGVDYGGFNLRFGQAVKKYVRKHRTPFVPWDPKLVHFVSPQVWASRPGRAYTLEKNYDLLLSIFPFEKNWYARRTPNLRVEFVGNPMLERIGSPITREAVALNGRTPTVLFLPGSRSDEVRRHWPVVTGTYQLLRQEITALRGRVVLPNETLAQAVQSLGVPPGLEVQVGGLTTALTEADLAITKSGTITMECAMFRVPAVVFYKTSWPTYLIGKQIIRVPYLAMPNLLSGEPVFPEFIQHAATPENISRAAMELLGNPVRRDQIRAQLAKVVGALGRSGATARAADAIVSLLP